ncbi:PEP-CTERM sorting domain-containing protein [Roseiconus lacunae]|uniref:PEP-CTERM sorting domain-containing protein n=1 Tax=Roseiconus lacunae TaxID=2605694 RepID=A0ABT7PDK2_9BACT|nr:PEP-CTERM sorting domain-containing protein [Roseiconus lacunae]MCD0459873.1 PEP-CTERM sorting domain-containing protein [Roseiconus lacunae]MDM4014572.1 PEP-CTERM sorting domain-containing protein [Roseiconus lacunae]WRQ49890.1 PEP-CTERM sorting domain-containing protein [Stieleria sp. HD01]
MTSLRKMFVIAACVTAIAGTAASAVAAPLLPATASDARFGWNFGDTGSINSAWNAFTVPAGAPGNLPDAGSFGSGEFSVLTSNGAGAFITSSGNLYVSGGPADFDVSIDTSDLTGDFTRVVAQIKTQGTEMDPSSLLLGGIAPSIGGVVDVQPLGGFGGAAVDYLAIWDLTTTSGPGANLTLEFGSNGPHMSLDQLQIDAFSQAFAFTTPSAIPEPATLPLLGALGAIGAFSRRRRRRA